MKFYDSLRINGIDYPIAVNISGNGAPTPGTEAEVGMLYMDTDTGDLYKCTAVGVWNKIGVGSDEVNEAIEAYGTLRGLPHRNGYIRSAGTWGVTTGFEHVLIPIECGQSVSIVGHETQCIYLAFLTEYTEAVDQSPLSFCADASFNKRIDLWAGRSAEYIAPEDAKYLYVQTLYSSVETYPTSLVIGNYEYCQGLDYNVKRALNDDGETGGTGEVVDIFNPLVFDTEWEAGSINLIEGSPLTDLNGSTIKMQRKRTGYLSFNERVNIVSDGTYTLTLCLCDENLNLKTYRQYTDFYSGDFLCIPPNTTFRLMIYDAADMTKDISAVTSEEVNEHIAVYRNGTSYFTNPKVRWCAMGDSITQGYVSTGANAPNTAIPAKGWAHKLADMKNWIITNLGYGGSGFIQSYTVNKASYQIARDTDFTQFDIVTLAYGINDWHNNAPLGSVEAYDASIENPTDVSSSLCKTLDTIIASNPLCKIVVITPLNCWWFGTESTNWAIGASNGAGVTLEQFTQAIKSVCEYYGVECIDMTHNSVVNRKNIQTCMLDQVHPTEAAHTAIAHELAAKIPFN